MTFLAAACAFLCQTLVPAPEPGEVGGEVTLRVRDAAGNPLPGVAVQVCGPGGERAAIGSTDAAGVARFRPEMAGAHELRAELPGGLLLITPYTVLAPARRWTYVLVCVPAGILLLWWNLRRRTWAARPDRGGSDGAAGAGAVRPAASPPDP